MAAHPIEPSLQPGWSNSFFRVMPVFAHFADDLAVGRCLSVDEKIVPGCEQRSDDFCFLCLRVCKEVEEPVELGFLLTDTVTASAALAFRPFFAEYSILL